jgi:hypothetical protein
VHEEGDLLPQISAADRESDVDELARPRLSGPRVRAGSEVSLRLFPRFQIIHTHYCLLSSCRYDVGTIGEITFCLSPQVEEGHIKSLDQLREMSAIPAAAAASSEPPKKRHKKAAATAAAAAPPAPPAAAVVPLEVPELKLPPPAPAAAYAPGTSLVAELEMPSMSALPKAPKKKAEKKETKEPKKEKKKKDPAAAEKKKKEKKKKKEQEEEDGKEEKKEKPNKGKKRKRDEEADDDDGEPKKKKAKVAKDVFWAVAAGVTPGIYKGWKGDASLQVTGFTDAVYKRFDKEADATAWIEKFKAEPAAFTARFLAAKKADAAKAKEKRLQKKKEEEEAAAAKKV